MQALAYELNLAGARLARAKRRSLPSTRMAAAALSPAPSGRSTRRRRCRPTSTILAPATSPSTRSPRACRSDQRLMAAPTRCCSGNDHRATSTPRPVFRRPAHLRRARLRAADGDLGTITDLRSYPFRLTPTALVFGPPRGTFTIGLNCALGANAPCARTSPN